MQHVIVESSSFVLFQIESFAVVDAKQVVSEAGDHEKLLKRADHVADAAQVLDSSVWSTTIALTWRCVVPAVRLLDVINHWLKLVVEESSHDTFGLADKLNEELVCGFLAVGRSSRLILLSVLV